MELDPYLILIAGRVSNGRKTETWSTMPHKSWKESGKTLWTSEGSTLSHDFGSVLWPLCLSSRVVVSTGGVNTCKVLGTIPGTHKGLSMWPPIPSPSPSSSKRMRTFYKLIWEKYQDMYIIMWEIGMVQSSIYDILCFTLKVGGVRKTHTCTYKSTYICKCIFTHTQ